LARLIKPDVPVSGFGQSGLGSFRVKQEEAKFEDFKTQWCFKHGKGEEKH
jgi:hypothetical protein